MSPEFIPKEIHVIKAMVMKSRLRRGHGTFRGWGVREGRWCPQGSHHTPKTRVSRLFFGGESQVLQTSMLPSDTKPLRKEFLENDFLNFEGILCLVISWREIQGIACEIRNFARITIRAETITELILERAGPVILKTFLLQLKAFRVIPVICPARRAKP